MLETSRKWTKECSALCSPQKQVVLHLHPAVTCRLKRGKQKASELDRLCWSQEFGTLYERNCQHSASADSTAVSPLCAKVLGLPRFITCQGKVLKVFLRRGQWEVSPWISFVWLAHSCLPTPEKGYLHVKVVVWPLVLEVGH